MANPLDFKIINNPALFQDLTYSQISYRLVILHALQFYLASPKPDKKISFKSLLNAMHQVSTNLESSFYEQHFIELCPFKKKDGTGLLLIDRSDGCYPLVFYPADEKWTHGDRISAFANTISELLGNSDIFEGFLKKNPVWNKEVVEELRMNFNKPYLSDK
jgi:hypothetical protein